MSNVFVKPKFTVHYSIPWNSEKNIGKSYNKTMSLVGSDDWVCFIDGDAVHTSHFFGTRIESVIDNNPDYTLYTCYTNRVNCGYQIAPNVDKNTNDMDYHRTFGENIWNTYSTQVMDITKNSELSGMLILIKKKSWEKVGGFLEEKMLGVDNDIHRKVRNIGEKVGLMKGIYVQHWYRGGDYKNKAHLL
jgi:hypothetical protein